MNLNEYQGITFELDKSVAEGQFHVKVYGDQDGKEQYGKFTGASPVINFNSSVLGTRAERITLQHLQEGEFTVVVKSVYLIKKDGSREKCTPSVFWGCDLETVTLM